MALVRSAFRKSRRRWPPPFSTRRISRRTRRSSSSDRKYPKEVKKLVTAAKRLSPEGGSAACRRGGGALRRPPSLPGAGAPRRGRDRRRGDPRSASGRVCRPAPHARSEHGIPGSRGPSPRGGAPRPSRPPPRPDAGRVPGSRPRTSSRTTAGPRPDPDSRPALVVGFRRGGSSRPGRAARRGEGGRIRGKVSSRRARGVGRRRRRSSGGKAERAPDKEGNPASPLGRPRAEEPGEGPGREARTASRERPDLGPGGDPPGRGAPPPPSGRRPGPSPAPGLRRPAPRSPQASSSGPTAPRTSARRKQAGRAERPTTRTEIFTATLLRPALPPDPERPLPGAPRGSARSPRPRGRRRGEAPGRAEGVSAKAPELDRVLFRRDHARPSACFAMRTASSRV